MVVLVASFVGLSDCEGWLIVQGRHKVKDRVIKEFCNLFHREVCDLVHPHKLVSMWVDLEAGREVRVDSLDTVDLWDRAEITRSEGMYILTYPAWSAKFNEYYVDPYEFIGRIAPICTFTPGVSNLPRVGARVSAYDTPYRKWRMAYIIDRDEENYKVKVHWRGYTARHDKWIDISKINAY